jgi:hypothetical protein
VPLLLYADELKITAELTNTGNTRLTFSADNGMACKPSNAVEPSGTSTCTLEIKATQANLDYGSISRSLTFTGAVSSRAVGNGE